MNKLIDATATPLSSIFGSGFLVIVPILAGAVGPYSVFAMAGVCAPPEGSAATSVSGKARSLARASSDSSATTSTRRRPAAKSLLINTVVDIGDQARQSQGPRFHHS